MDSETREKRYLICPVCNKANDAESRFCQYCWGAALNQDTSYTEEELKIALEAREQVRGRKKNIRRGILGGLAGVAFILVVLYTINYTDIISRPSVELTSESSGGNWNMFRRDLERSGSYDNASQPAGILKWVFETGDRIHSSPAVVDGTVYVGSQDYNLYAINAETGAEKWAFKTGSWVSSSPAVVDGTVYVGSNDSYLYAIDAATGTKKWSFDTPYPVRSSPAVDNDGTVYFGSDDYYIHALDTETGKERWKHDTDSPAGVSPVIEEGILYYGSSGGFSYALNAKDGWQRLRYQTVFSVYSSPIVYNDVCYFATTNGYLHAVDDSARTWLWEHDIRPYWSQAWVMIGWFPQPPDQSGHLWTISLRKTISTTPAIKDNVMYLGAGSSLMAIDLDTHGILWEFDTGASVYSSPAVSGNVAYVGSNNGNLYAIDILTGEELWHYETGAAISSSPAVVNGVVYVGSDDGNLYAIE